MSPGDSVTLSVRGTRKTQCLLSALGNSSSHSLATSQFAKHLLLLEHTPAFHTHADSCLVMPILGQDPDKRETCAWPWGPRGTSIHFLWRGPVAGMGLRGKADSHCVSLSHSLFNLSRES